MDGYYADACVTVRVGKVILSPLSLVAASQATLKQAIATARAGTPNQRDRPYSAARRDRTCYSVCREVTGHSIGRRIHEWPTIFNYRRAWAQPATDPRARHDYRADHLRRHRRGLPELRRVDDQDLRQDRSGTRRTRS